MCVCVCVCVCVCSNSENTLRVCSLDDHTAVAKQRRWGRYPSFHGHSNSGANLDDEASHKGGAHSTSSPIQSKLKSRKQPLSRWVHAVLVIM